MIAKRQYICYNDSVMEKRVHFYVSRKNALTWLMTLCMVCSAVARIAFPGVKGSGDSLYVWSQIVLPVAAALLYAFIALLEGKELFYKTALPMWMTAIYFGFAVTGNYGFGRMVCALYWVALVFLAVIYTQITSGQGKLVWLLPPMLLAPMACILYLHRDALLARDFSALLHSAFLPNALMILGMLLQVFAIRIHPAGEYHPTWGDRVDGRRIRSMDPMNQIIPYIMVERNASSNLFEESFEITAVERFIRQKRRENMPNLGLTHLIIAAYVRSLCRYPGLNRFVSGQKVYSRGDDVQFCLTVKKDMSASSPETVIKVHFNRTDTLEDVYRKLNAQVEEVKNTPLDSSFDNTAHAFTLIPGVFLKFTIWLLKALDYFGLMPRFITEVSPFHGSLFLTSMGSLGIPPIYHHLYDFGNLPVFGAFGCKRRALEVTEDGTVVQRKYFDCKFTLDERITDGYYYAAFFKHFKRIFLHPEQLSSAPEEIERDID